MRGGLKGTSGRVRVGLAAFAIAAAGLSSAVASPEAPVKCGAGPCADWIFEILNDVCETATGERCPGPDAEPSSR
ncbi:MAG TPA: hypothetical protein VGB52_15680 [Actinomycetota bacterium]